MTTDKKKQEKKGVNWNKITGIGLICVAIIGCFYVLIFDKTTTDTVKLAFLGFFGLIIGKGVELFKKKS